MCFRVWGEFTQIDSMQIDVLQLFRQEVENTGEISLSDFSAMLFVALFSVNQISFNRVVCFIPILIVKVDKYLLEHKIFRIRHDEVNRNIVVGFVFVVLVNDTISIPIRDVHSKLTSQKRHFVVIGAVKHKDLLRFIREKGLLFVLALHC